MQPEQIADYQCQTGENPLWHPMEKRLYWTDIPSGRLFRYTPATGEHEQCYQGLPVGGFTVQADGALLLFMQRGAIAIWRAGKFNYLIEEIPAEHQFQFNDVIADPIGRVFCGTMSSPGYDHKPGRLYRLDTDGSLTLLLDGIGVSNGLGFSPDRRRLYYTDSDARKIYQFDYDQGSGNISNQRVFVEIRGDGVPDGMTVDAEGCIWSARWGGAELVRYRPDASEERHIRFPARKVSSLTFGGDDLMDIYVTTALTGNTRAEEGSGAGALFRVNLGIRGVPEFFSRINVL